MSVTSEGTLETFPYPAGHTRQELRELVAQYFGWHELTLTGGSTSTAVQAGYTYFDSNYFVGAQVWVRQADGAAPQGETAYCTAFVPATGTLTLAPTLTAALQAGDEVEVFMRVTKDAIDRALARVSYGASQWYALTPATTTLDYVLTGLPALHSARQVRAVWLRDRGDVLVQPTQVLGWQVADAGGLLTLRLPGRPDSSDELWVEYLGGEDALQHDSDRINLPTELVYLRAVVQLIVADLLPRQDQAGQQHWGSLLRDLREQLARAERTAHRAPGKVQGPTWDRASNRDGADALGLRTNYGNSFGNFP